MHWLIDGHNLIGAMPGLRLSDPHDEDKLLEYLRRYRAKTGHRLTVIFDAGHTYHSPETKKQGGLTIQFAPHQVTADQIIMQRVRRVKNSQGMMVVSSDRRVQQAAQNAGVRVISAQAFSQQLLALNTGDAPAEAGTETEVQLSPTEVAEWLAIFKKSKR